MENDFGRYSLQREVKVNSLLILHCYLLSFDKAYVNISLYPILKRVLPCIGYLLIHLIFSLQFTAAAVPVAGIIIFDAPFYPYWLNLFQFISPL